MPRLKRLLIVVVFASFAAPAIAGPPSSVDPDGYLPLFRGPGGKPHESPRKILAVLQKEVPEIAKKVEQFQKTAEGAEFKKLQLKDVGLTNVKIEKLIRGVDHLMMWGEPAAVGYYLQLQELRKQQSALIGRIKEDPYFKTKLNRDSNRVRSAYKMAARSLPRRVDSLIDKGKADEARTRLDLLQDPIEAAAVFYPPSGFATDRKEFTDREKKIDGVLWPARGRIIQRYLGTIRDKRLPPYDKLWRYAEDLVLKVKSDEPTEPGPAILAKFAKGWRDAQIGGMQCQALDTMIEGSFKGVKSDDVDRGEWLSKKKRLVEEHDKFTKKMDELVVALIEADAVRSTPEEIEKLYPQYLEAASLLIALHGDDTFRDRIEAALEKLRQKSERLVQDIAAYEAATGKVLHWRRTVAEAYSVKQQQTFPPLDETFARLASRSVVKNERLLDEDAAKADLKSLAISTYGRMPTNYLSKEMLGKKAVVRDGIGLRMNGMQEAYPLKTRLDDRHYAGYTGKSPWIASAIASLESDLLVDAQRTIPLTLEAQLALSSARRGDVLEFGGRVSALMLESVLTRQASLTPGDWGMVRIGELPTLGSPGIELLKQVQVRFVVNPLWIRHKYFYVDLAEQNQSS